MDDEANALRGSAAHAAPGLDSRLWPLPPVTGAEPNPGVITDEWILSQVVFDEEAEAPIPAAVLQIEKGPPLDEVVVPPNQELPSISPSTPRGCSILVPYMGPWGWSTSIASTSVRVSLFRLGTLKFGPN